MERNFSKKSSLLIALVFIISVAVAFAFFTDSSLFKGQIKLKAKNENILQQSKFQGSVQKIKDQKNILAALKNSTKNSKIKKDLTDAERKLSDLVKKIEKAPEKQKIELLHQYRHEKIEEKIETAKEIQELPNTISKLKEELDSLQKLIKQNEKNYDFSKINNSIIKLKQEIDSTNSLIKKAKAEDVQKLADKISKITLKEISYMSDEVKEIKLPAYLIELFTAKFKTIQLLAFSNLPVLPPNFPLTLTADNGEKRVALCVMRWTEDLPLPSEDEMRAAVERANDYYQEISFGQASITLTDIIDTGEVLGGALPETVGDEVDIFIDNCDPFIDFDEIDGLIIYPSIIGGALASGDVRLINADDDYFWFPIIELGDFSMAENRFNGDALLEGHTLEHELGHALFDQLHANSLECGGVTFSDEEGVCQRQEYGNPFDVMGISGYGGHFTAWKKFMDMGWIEAQNIMSDSDFLLGALEEESDQPQLIRIPYQENAICLEYRKPINRDAVFSVANLNMEMGLPDEGGLMVSICDLIGGSLYAGGQRSYNDLLLDTLPHSNREMWVTDDNKDAFIRIGEILEIPDLFLRISWQQEDDLTANVHVDLKEENIANTLDIKAEIGVYGFRWCFEDAMSYYVLNSSEIPIEDPFTVQIWGVTDQSEEIFLERERIGSMETGEIITRRFTPENAREYKALILRADTGQEIQESDENNEWRIEQDNFCRN